MKLAILLFYLSAGISSDLSLAKMLIVQELYVEALQLLDNDTDARARYYAGWCHMKMGNCNSATAEFNEFLESYVGYGAVAWKEEAAANILGCSDIVDDIATDEEVQLKIWAPEDYELINRAEVPIKVWSSSDASTTKSERTINIWKGEGNSRAKAADVPIKIWSSSEASKMKSATIVNIWTAEANPEMEAGSPNVDVTKFYYKPTLSRSSNYPIHTGKDFWFELENPYQKREYTTIYIENEAGDLQTMRCCGDGSGEVEDADDDTIPPGIYPGNNYLHIDLEKAGLLPGRDYTFIFKDFDNDLFINLKYEEDQKHRTNKDEKGKNDPMVEHITNKEKGDNEPMVEHLTNKEKGDNDPMVEHITNKEKGDNEPMVEHIANKEKGTTDPSATAKDVENNSSLATIPVSENASYHILFQLMNNPNESYSELSFLGPLYRDTYYRLGNTRYLLGNFDSKEAALQFLPAVNKTRFKSAFVAEYRNGKLVKILQNE